MPDLKDTLIDVFQKTYTEQELKFSLYLFDEIQSLKLDDNSKMTAFLMNADISKENIRKLIEFRCGNTILQNIELLKRIGNISFSIKDKTISALRQSFIGLTDDIKIIMIKLAERLVSLRIADKEQKDNIAELADECLYFYSPVAQMLGIRKIYNEMEDIAFKNLFPKDFEFLQKKISEKEAIFNSKLTSMKNDLLKILVENKIEARLQSRIKRPYSVYRKLKNQKNTLEGIYDLLALRVITKSVDSCYLTLGVVHSKWVPIEGRFRDWITYPKPNGYRSIQTTVTTRKGDKFEIQIRTEEMHEEAEYGSSAHWAYKQGGEAQKIGWVQSLREFLDNDEYFENPYQFFENLKSEMKRDHINVLTPKGEIISLPSGSTPIDFAYSVHSGLGDHITGAKVNGKFIKLKTELKSGDVIDILTNPSATPSRDWLTIVKTSRARSKILRWFKKNERELYIIQGRNAWERLKSVNRRKIMKFEDELKLKANLAKIGYKTFDDFFYSISNGGVKCSLFLLKKLYPDAFKASETEKIKSSSKIKEFLPPVRVEGLEHIETKFARCCNPIKGEPIIAYITKKSELKIHSSNCAFLKLDNVDKNNLKKAEWLSAESSQLVRCKLFGDNYTKILSQLVTAADDEHLRIIATQNLSLRGNKEGLLLEVEVRDISQFERFTQKLRNSPGIETVKLA